MSQDPTPVESATSSETARKPGTDASATPPEPASRAVLWAKMAAVAILATVVFTLFGRSSPPPHATLPKLELPMLDGTTLKTADLHGKVYILNFFATWCGPCRAEMPDLNRFYETRDPERVELIGIAAGNEHRLEVKPFVEQFPLKFPIALEGEPFLMYFQSDALPTTIVLAPDGSPVAMAKGMVSEDWLNEKVRLALSHSH